MSTPPLDEQVITPLLYGLVECLAAELALSPGGSPCVVSPVPGLTVAQDYCDCTATSCGMGWVRLDGYFPSTRFPNPDLGGPVYGQYAARFQVGVHRCAPSMGPQGQPPGLQAQLDAERIQLGDIAAIQRAIDCCWERRERLVGSYTPVGPNGGCVGGSFMVTVKAS